MGSLSHYGTKPKDLDGVLVEQTSNDDGELMILSKEYGVGIDTHSKFIYVSVIVRVNGELRRHDNTFETAWDQLILARRWIREILVTKPVPPITEDITHFHYTIESTSVYHYPVMKALDGSPSVVNPLLASPSRRKTDALDAKLLAYQNITGLWPSSYVVNDDINAARVLLAQRETMRDMATKTSNQINNYIIRYGITLGRLGSVTATKYIRAIIEDKIEGRAIERDDCPPTEMPIEVRQTLKMLYDRWDDFKKKQKEFEVMAIEKIKSIEWVTGEGELVQGDVLLQKLCTVPAIGPVAASIWLCNICDINRFPCCKACVAFSGLDPSLKVSAGKVTSVVKRGGNKAIHWVLTQAAQVLLRNRSEAFGIWGYQIYVNSGKYKKAVSAVARRLAVGLYHVHRTNTEFSYQGYKVETRHEVEYYGLSELCQMIPELKRWYRTLLIDGYTDTKLLVQAYDDFSLKTKKGYGKKFFEILREFINNQKKYRMIYNTLHEQKGEDGNDCSQRKD